MNQPLQHAPVAERFWSKYVNSRGHRNCRTCMQMRGQ